MKYFTKEFYAMQYLSILDRLKKQSIYAEVKDEDFYQKRYKRIYTIFSNNEKMSDWYIDPVKELREVEAYANEPDISDEERKQRTLCKEAYIAVNKKRIESGKFFKFDSELCKRKFEENQRELIEVCNLLPKEILNKIADIRVFALGYASKEVMTLLRTYCKKLRKTVEDAIGAADTETDFAEKNLQEPIGFTEFKEINILGLEEKDGDIYIKLEDENLIVKNGKITEGQCKPIFPYNREKPNCMWSRILVAELHLNKGVYEINFLMSTLNEIEKNELWYLTICGSDILKISV